MLITMYEAFSVCKNKSCDDKPVYKPHKTKAIEKDDEEVGVVDQIKEGDDVIVPLKGKKAEGSVLYIAENHVDVKVVGDTLKFRQFDMSDLELKKE
ncbi:unnamed protein product [marine sediment metagenome]|uniref:Uncharacterized protein n=1 Tax=marine sediment metagenome TaxID=412755 RepID=X1DGI6_9ZZZZ